MKTLYNKAGEFANKACNGSGGFEFDRCRVGYVAGYETCIAELVFKGNYLKLWNNLTQTPKLTRIVGEGLQMHSADINTCLRQMQKRTNLVACVTEGRFKYWFRNLGER